MPFFLALPSLIYNSANSFALAWIQRPLLSSTILGRMPLQVKHLSASVKPEPSNLLAEQQALKKHTVTWLTEDTRPTDADNQDDTPPLEQSEQDTISFHVFDGETLRTAALRRNVASPHNGRANLINCRGIGTCGTCALEVLEGTVDPPKRNRIEQLRFNFPPHNFHNNTKLRLACQIQIKGNVTVCKRTGFWGQKRAAMVPSSPGKPFGNLEYLLDTKSPEDPENNSSSKKNEK